MTQPYEVYDSWVDYNKTTKQAIESLECALDALRNNRTHITEEYLMRTIRQLNSVRSKADDAV